LVSDTRGFSAADPKCGRVQGQEGDRKAINLHFQQGREDEVPRGAKSWCARAVWDVSSAKGREEGVRANFGAKLAAM
jgi:hypothetical protein